MYEKGRRFFTVASDKHRKIALDDMVATLVLGVIFYRSTCSLCSGIPETKTTGDRGLRGIQATE